MEPGKNYEWNKIVVTLGGKILCVKSVRWTRCNSTDDVNTLKEYLQEAIEKEDYEEAADLRDAINRLS